MGTMINIQIKESDMEWLLIVFLVMGGGEVAVSAQFEIYIENKELCERAVETIQGEISGSIFTAFCIQVAE